MPESPDHDLTLKRRLEVEDKLNRFEQAWEAAKIPQHRPRLEDYLDSEETANRVYLLEELIRIDAEFRNRHHENPVAEEYHSRFPDLDADSLARILQPYKSPTEQEGTEPYVPVRSPVYDSPSSGESSVFAAPLKPGQSLGERYRILGLVGKGGMGFVYKAEDRKLRKTVALKVLNKRLSRDKAFLEFLLAEAATAQEVSHENVCRVHDIGEADGHHFLSMQFIEGENLATLLRQVNRFTYERSEEIALQICKGLQAAHDRKVLHRDLKPGNVMIDRNGRVLLTDFGLACQSDDIERKSEIAGTPAYMAPEQLAGKEVSEKSDLYSLGLVLYEIFTGDRIFKANTLHELKREHERVSVQPIKFDSDTPPRIRNTIRSCLEPNPQDRPVSADAVGQALSDRIPTGGEIAAGGGKGALTLRQGCLYLTGVAIGLIVLVLMSDSTTVQGQVNPASIEAMATKSRIIVQQFGYYDPDQPPVGVAYGYMLDHEYIDRQRVNIWNDNQYSVDRRDYLKFWYRQSPKYLVADAFFPQDYTVWFDFRPGRISPQIPSPRQPGMVSLRLRLNGGGTIGYFLAVPEKLSESASDSAPDWYRWFDKKMIGDNLKRWKEDDTPIWVPPVAFDYHAAWTLPATKNRSAERIEAASFQGKLVWFRRAENSEGNVVTSDMRRRRPVGPFLLMAVYAMLIVMGLVVARWNVFLGRADRDGAAKIALISLGLFFVGHFVQVDHVPTMNEFDLFELVLASSLYLTFVIWILYLAAEPYVRRYWRETLVSWSRLMQGRIRDPMVGRDILAGILAGTAAWLINYANVQLPRLIGWSSLPEMYFAPRMVSLIGPRFFLAELCNIVQWGIFVAIIMLLSLLILRGLCRKPLLAYGLFVVMWTMASASTAGHPYFSGLHNALRYVLVVIIITRFGFLAMVSWMCTIELLLIGISADPSRWYFEYGLSCVLLVFGFACWAFYTATRGSLLLENLRNK